MKNRVLLNILYYLILGIVFMTVYNERLGVFSSFYLYCMTITTVGYGDLSGVSSPERVMSILAAFSPYVTLGVEGLLYHLRSRKVTLEKEEDLVVIANTTLRLQGLLESLKGSDIATTILCDNYSTETIDELNRLRDTYNVKVKMITSIYDEGLFNGVDSINTALIMTSGDLTGLNNIHRSVGTVQVIESLYGSCRTICEVPAITSTLTKISNADKFTEQLPTELLAKEIIKEGAIDAYTNLVSRRTI